MRIPLRVGRTDGASRSPSLPGTVLPGIALPLRVCCVAVFAALSVALIMYPVDFRLEYSPIQSVDAIPMVWVFSLLLLAWMGLLVALIWSTDNAWAVAGLVVCFGLVYFSFWTLRWANGFWESWLKIQGVQVILSSGHVEAALMHYSDWPGIAIHGAMVSIIAGREIADLVVSVVLVVQLALALGMFVLFRRILGNSRRAALAVMVAVMANGYLARFHFHAFWFGLVLMIPALLLLVRSLRQQSFRSSDVLLLLILAVALAVWHLYTGFLLAALTATMYLAHRWRWTGPHPRPSLFLLVVLFAGFIAVWQLYWARSTENEVLKYIPRFLHILIARNFEDLFVYSGAVGVKNVVGLPVWANATRLAWLAGLYLFGAILSCWVVIARHRFPPELRVTAAWVLAVAAISAGATLLRGEEFRRFIMFGTLFTAPVLIAVLWHIGHKAALITAAIALVVGAVPSFLVNGNVVSTQSFFTEQRSAGEFLEVVLHSERPGEGVMIFGTGATAVGWYYIPFATRISSPLVDQGASDLREFVRQGNQNNVLRFLRGDATGKLNLFWLDASQVAIYEAWFGVGNTDYALELVMDGLKNTTRLYDNGLVQLWI